jgi:hypothetical protein
MRSTVRLAAALVLAAVCTVASAAAQPIKLFVGAPLKGGFVDASKEILDSTKDVQGRLRGTKGVLLVARPADADLVLTIVARGVGSDPYGQRLVYQEHYGGADLVSLPISLNTWWVAAVLEVRNADYRKEFVGIYTHPPGVAYVGGAWRECGSRLAKDLKVWLEANADRLRNPSEATARE